MKRYVGMIWFVCVWVAVVAAAADKTMSVQIKNAMIRSTPSYLGQVVASVDYGARLTVTGQQGPWVQVVAPNGAKGWLHQSALTPKQIVMSAGEAPARTGASAAEMALAGKGFNAEVERNYRKNGDIDYTWVDRMIGYVVSPSETVAFLREGGLPVNGGAQ